MELLKRSILFPMLGLLAVATLSWRQPMPGHFPHAGVTHYGAIPHSDPVLTFGGKRSGASLSIQKFPKPAVLLPTFDKGNVFVRIERFTMQVSGAQGVFSQTYSGNLLPADALRHIRVAMPGSKLRFTDVVCELGDGSKRHMEAVYTLTH